MKIQRLDVEGFPPITKFETGELPSLVVIAGANGSGKTRLLVAISNTFRNPSSSEISLTARSTRKEEREAWGDEILEIEKGAENTALQNYMNSRSRGGTYVGSVIQIDSDRSVQAVKFQPITLATPDPDDAEINFIYYLSPFANRWPDLVNKIFQKAAYRDQNISRFVKSNPKEPGEISLKKYPDPFIPYQEVFGELLPGKILDAIDPTQLKEFQYTIDGQDSLVFQTLSSGEQEVVRVSFDLIWKRIRHSVILIDEPELHLHPSLTFQLIETLKGLGGGTNQLILFTHSVDLISTYYSTGGVYFIDTGAAGGQNQAKQLSDIQRDHSHTARSVGANLGMFAVGKKLVFVEGTDASVDRFTYHRVAQKAFPEARFLPLGSVRNINSLREVAEELQSAIFGVDLFMIRDRDGLSDDEVSTLEKNARFRVLKRRHVENYFLDSDVLSKVAKLLYLPSQKGQADAIEEALLEAAKAGLNRAILSDVQESVYLTGSVDIPKVNNSDALSLEELSTRIAKQLAVNAAATARRFDEAAAEQLVEKRRKVLEASLRDGSWKKVLPGKAILARFVGTFWGEDLLRVRQAYIDVALAERPNTFRDMREILEHFREA